MQRGSKRKRVARGAARRSKSNWSGRARPQDAIALLKADHRQVEEWFEQFENTSSSTRKSDLATKICNALRAHTILEEEIFYPAFLEATEEEDIHHEAEVEHDGAKKLIAQIEKSGPNDDYFDARVTVLAEMIKHHVKEEEKRDGMFAKARASDMDLVVLGEQLAARKAQVMGSDAEDDEAPRRSRRGGERDAGMMARDPRRSRAE